MCCDDMMALAKQDLAEKVGVKVQNLYFSFIWEFGNNIYFSFQINQPGHAHNGSTMSVNVSKIKNV